MASTPSPAFREFLAPSSRHGADLPTSGVGDNLWFTDSSLPDLNSLDLLSDTNMNWNTLPTLSRTPVSLASPKFDLHAINSAIMEAAPTSFHIGESLLNLENPELRSTDSPKPYSLREQVIRRQWFTYLESDNSQSLHRDKVSEHTQVDARFRDDLSQRLQFQTPYEPLPSTDFLNLCVQTYFNRFNPIFPIVHGATFKPSATSSLLLLAMCAVGSSFLACPQATRQGRSIFERLNKAILASWETVISRGLSDALSLIQASLIVQTFSMLSGTPANLLLAQSFHGTIITLARRSGVFLSERSETCNNDVHDQGLDISWRRWVQEEEQARVSAALFIHDAELSLLFNTEPSMRHVASKLPSISSNTEWMAPTAEEWRNAQRKSGGLHGVSGREQAEVSRQSHLPVTDRTRPDRTSFRIYCELEGIAASINTAKELDALSSTTFQLEQSLLQFHKSYLKQPITVARDPFCLGILWHSAFISLFADLNRLEMAAGRDGLERSQMHTAYAKSWSRSQEARRCALHGMMILQKAESMPIGAEPAIHVPRALYCAAMVWYCYTEFGWGEVEDTPRPLDDGPEFEMLGIDASSLLVEAHGFRTSRPSKLESLTLVSLIDLLRRMGHSEISDRMATLMISIIHGHPDGESTVPG
ncbi:hypothetical protein PV08_03707 [Exophiala spinifera]|uniref:Xylanolytic transcriptional activator regulatory domain-containing protein n=1 Tax=Exophiala spinifera TaxID=91928 RepID=A0A0D2A3E2_9EURO|nr:uncharacterized protein PV08_03707 [Exophiala spinifera]KIW19412.1 hypothetical protein PV08_03707 [Exophiala spinifera]